MNFPSVWFKNTKFIMRFSLLIIGIVSVSLQVGYATNLNAQGILDKPVSGQFTTLPIKEVLNAISLKTGVDFLYTTKNELKQKITAKFSGQSLANVLDNILKKNGLTYEVSFDKILVFSSPKPPVESVVKGVVTDENGTAMPGVSVYVKGSGPQTVTNTSGNYSLKIADENATIVFSYIGYLTQEMKALQRTTINIRLLPDNAALSEVVVTALNMKRNARSLGYSITKVDGSNLNAVQTPNIISALSGKVAGVDVSNVANGVAGSKRIIIRGAASLTGNNQPLWVIDGIPISSSILGSGDAFGGIDYGDGLTGINPDDIESISVLKGNAAAALYGSRASNGVMLVTTKSGKSAKGKTNLDFSSSLLVDQLSDLSDYQQEYGQSSRININQRPVDKADAFGADSWGPKFDGVPTVQFDGVLRPYSPVADNFKRFFETGSTITNTLALSGNYDNHNYRVSISDLRNNDIIPQAGFNRTSINAKTTSKFGKLEADIVLNYSYEKAANRPFTGGNVNNLFYSLMGLPANINIESLKPGFNPNGSEFTYADFINNPYFIVNKDKEEDKKNRLVGSATLKYDFTDWLYARGRITRDYYTFNRMRYTPDGVLYTGFLLGSLDQVASSNVENNYEFILGVNPVLKGKFNFNGFIGGNVNWRAFDQLNTSGDTFVVPGVYTFNNLKNKLPSTSQTRQRTNSLFGSAEFSYDKYLYLTFTGRNDWFSTLPIENNNLFYPSVALSFVFSDAMKMPSWVSFGKVRASTAQVSGDAGPGQLDLSYTLDGVQYDGGSLQNIGTSNIPNRNLKPLLSTDYEYGLEMDFFNNRLGFDASYYSRKTRNDIVRTAVSPTTGYATAVLNVGRLQNNGIEIAARATPVKGEGFSWNLTATYSKNNSKVIALADGVAGSPIQLASSKSAQATIRLVEGQPYGQIYGSTYLRDANGRKIFDSNGLPMVNSTQTFLGNGVYNQLAGLSNTFNYKNFALYFLLDAKFGAKIYSETNAGAVSNGKHKMTLEGRETGIIGNGVNQSGGENTVKVPAEKLNEYYKRISGIAEEFIDDASFIKLREVSFSYKIPAKFLSKIKVSNASISLVGRNLLTLYKNIDNVDPESSVNSSNAQGIERYVYPITRNYGLTLKVGL